MREGAKLVASGYLKQGVWGAQPPADIGCLVFKVIKTQDLEHI